MSAQNNRCQWIALSILAVSLAFVPIARALPPTSIVQFQECDPWGGSCQNRMVVTVPVSYGLESWLQRIIPVPGEQDEILDITIAKTAPVLHYPLKYIHTVAYLPRENVSLNSNPVGPCEQCNDNPLASCPTCGWMSFGGIPIPYSQGFCASGLHDADCAWYRGKEIFGVQDPAVAFSTAHCMRTGSLYFNGYEIGEYRKSFQVSIRMFRGTDEFNLVLTPENPMPFQNFEFTLKAQLLGDLAGYRGAPQLDNYILYIPSSPSTDPMVQDYANNMLLVPREEVSRDGGEPDKVGVSFYTFRQQAANAAKSRAGDGLHNQLFQKYNGDLEVLIANPNADTTYLVTGKKAFKGSMNFTSGMPRELQLKVAQIESSLVSLTMDPGAIRTIEADSVGMIRFAKVAPFSSLTNDGTLEVGIWNAGDMFTANYLVTVTSPTANINPAIPAQAVTLNPHASTKVFFDIFARQNLLASHSLLVSLSSPTGKLYDATFVTFDTNEHPVNYSWNLQQTNTESGTATLKSVPGDSTCDGAVDLSDLAVLSRHWLEGKN